MKMNDFIFEKYSKLPKDIQVKVLEYMEFLLLKYQEKFSKDPKQKRKSNFGSAKGLIIMEDGFDDPLEDFNPYSL